MCPTYNSASTDTHTAEYQRLEEHANQSIANNNHTDCLKQVALYVGQTVSVINNDRMLWLHATVVCVADHHSYIIKDIGRAESRCV